MTDYMDKTPMPCAECGHLHYYGQGVFSTCRVCDDCPQNPPVYPVTDKLTRRLAERDLTENPIAKAAIEYLGEYEHGSVSLTDLMGDNTEYDLEQLGDVLYDFVGYSILSLAGQETR